jgi:hypothetical protein
MLVGPLEGVQNGPYDRDPGGCIPSFDAKKEYNLEMIFKVNSFILEWRWPQKLTEPL